MRVSRGIETRGGILGVMNEPNTQLALMADSGWVFRDWSMLRSLHVNYNMKQPIMSNELLGVVIGGRYKANI